MSCPHELELKPSVNAAHIGVATKNGAITLTASFDQELAANDVEVWSYSHRPRFPPRPGLAAVARSQRRPFVVASVNLRLVCDTDVRWKQ